MSYILDEFDEYALAAGEGNQYALDRFVEMATPAIRSLCRHLGDPETEQDLVQETFAQVLRSLPNYRAEGPVRAWIIRITRNTCADLTRLRQRSRQHVSAQELPEVAVESDTSGWIEVASSLETLSAERRAAFVMTQILNMSYEQAAKEQGVAVGTIRSRVARARAQLRKEALVDGEEIAPLNPSTSERDTLAG